MIIGTAGHIDHGKSALVRALTGQAMDRLAEERRRGITIDLNFAPLELEGTDPIGIVDVPGHEDFVRTMVAGATGIDLVLLVVDAAEGVRPQTREHLAVVEQLGVPRGIPVLAKADLVEPDWLELVAAELAEQLSASPVTFASPVATSAVSGLGLDRLRALIREEAARIPSRDPEDLFRMPVDRVFAVAGAGTVVTGTTWAGTLRVGALVRLLPDGPEARVRSIEGFGRAVDAALPGARTAIGLAGSGVSREQVRRGQLLVSAADPWMTTTAFDAVVRLGRDAAAPLRPRQRIRVHHGTAEVMARLHPREPIEPGGAGRARLSLEQPLVLRGGDRFVVRQYSPVTTLGGGWVLDPAPPPRSPWPAGLDAEDPVPRLDALVARRRGGVPMALIPLLAGVAPGAVDRVGARLRQSTRVAEHWVASDRVDSVRGVLRSQVDTHHRDQPASPGVSIETLRSGLGPNGWMVDELLRGDDGLTVWAGIVARAGFEPRAPGGEAEIGAVVGALEAAGIEPPAVSDLILEREVPDLQGVLRLAAARGLVEQVERDRWYARSALDRFTAAVREAGAGGQDISPADLRDRTGLSRKYLIPLLEWADRSGLTIRDHTGTRRLRP